jgi:HEAT repeat protein
MGVVPTARATTARLGFQAAKAFSMTRYTFRLCSALAVLMLDCACGHAAEGRDPLDAAVARLTDWNTAAADRAAAVTTLTNAGRAAVDHVHVLAQSKIWAARRDALSIAEKVQDPALPRLVAAGLRDRNWAVRQRAASVAGRLKAGHRPGVEPALKALFKDRIAKVRLAAYAALATWHPKGDYVAQALGDPDPEVSYWAAKKYRDRVLSGKVSGKAKERLIDSIIAQLRAQRWQDVDNVSIVTLLKLGPAGLNALYEAMLREPPAVRRQAVASVGSKGGKAVVDLMFRFLDEWDANVRRTAMSHVASHAGPRHAPRLLKLLKTSGNVETRQYALQALGRLKYKPALPHMVQLLDHQNYGLRQTVLSALSQMGDKSVAPKLVRMFRAETHGWRRSQLVRPIAQLLGKDGADFLREAVRDDHQSVRTYALHALSSQLSEDNRYDILLSVIKHEDDDGVRQTAIGNLSQEQATKAEDVLLDVLKDGGPQSRRAAAYSLARVKSVKATRALIEAYANEDDPNVREAVISSLGQVQDRRAVPVLKRALRSKDARLRLAALNALARFPDVLSDTFLVRFVRAEENDDVLRVCISQLNSRSVGDATLIPRLAKLMNAADNSLRFEAIRYVARIGTADATRVLCKAIRDDTYSSVRNTALSSLLDRLKERTVRAGTVVKSLGEALETNDANARRRIVTTLGELADPELAPVLLGVLKKDTDPSVRRAAAEAVRPVAGADMVPALLEAARAEERTATLVALVGVLGRVGDRAALPFFKKCLRASDPAVQAAALRAIRAFKDASLVPFYVERFKESTSVEVRLTTLRSLAGCGDRRALPVFRQGLKDAHPQVRHAARDALADFCDTNVAKEIAEAVVEGRFVSTGKDELRPLVCARLRPVADDFLAAAQRAQDPGRARALYLVLAWMGDRRAAEPLARMAADEADPVDVLRALVHVRARKSVGLCLTLARRSVGESSRVAAWAAVQLGPPPGLVDVLATRVREGTPYQLGHYAPLLARAGGKRGRRMLAERLAESTDPAAVAVLCRALPSDAAETAGRLCLIARSTGDLAARVAAIEALSRIEGGRAQPVLEAILTSTAPAIVRAAALRQLGGKELGVERLGQYLESAESELRLAAADATASLENPRQLEPALTAAAAQQEDTHLRAAAVRALGSLRASPAARAALVAALETDPDSTLTKAIVRSLGRLRAPDTAGVLTKLASSAGLEVRVAVVEALGRLDTKPARKAVEEAFAQETVDRVRAAAARQLGRTGDRAYVPRLAEALKSVPALDVRAACAEALGRLGGEQARAAVKTALQHDSGLVREAAVRALAAMRGPGTARALKAVVEDPDADTAAAARGAVAEVEGET